MAEHINSRTFLDYKARTKWLKGNFSGGEEKKKSRQVQVLKLLEVFRESWALQWIFPL